MSDSHSDLDLYDFSLLQDNDISGSANAKFKSCVCVFTDWAKTPSVTRGGGSQSISTRAAHSGLAAIAAWHCVSSVNTDDSRQTALYYNLTKLQ